VPSTLALVLFVDLATASISSALFIVITPFSLKIPRFMAVSSHPKVNDDWQLASI
jgi:hypothetical protein